MKRKLFNRHKYKNRKHNQSVLCWMVRYRWQKQTATATANRVFNLVSFVMYVLFFYVRAWPHSDISMEAFTSSALVSHHKIKTNKRVGRNCKTTWKSSKGYLAHFERKNQIEEMNINDETGRVFERQQIYVFNRMSQKQVRRATIVSFVMCFRQDPLIKH